MKDHQRHLVHGALMGGAWCALVLAGGLEMARAGSPPRERWDVKTMSDPAAANVATTPLVSTIAALAARPPVCNARGARGAGQEEWQVYEVLGRLVSRRRERDGDLHLVLEDVNTPGQTLVAEVPRAAAAHPDIRGQVAGARRAAQKASLGDVLRVRGVGFYDRGHGQHGAATSCLELHPVLWVRLAWGSW